MVGACTSSHYCNRGCLQICFVADSELSQQVALLKNWFSRSEDDTQKVSGAGCFSGYCAWPG